MRKYAICCESRSGSYRLCDLLTNNGIGEPDEYLNQSVREKLPVAEREKWLATIIGEHSVNNIFGVKTSLDVYRFWEKWLNPDRHIWLRRRNVAEQAFSWYRVEVTDVWHKFKGKENSAPMVEYNQSRIEFYCEEVVRRNRAWMEFFEQNHLNPLQVWYEDIDSQPAEQVDRVAQFLGFELKVPIKTDGSHEKQRDERQNQEWKALLMASGYSIPLAD